MLKRLLGISCKTSRGFSRRSQSLEGDVAPPGKRQLLPTIAIGSRGNGRVLFPVIRPGILKNAVWEGPEAWDRR
jgi:hypothetical protein